MLVWKLALPMAQWPSESLCGVHTPQGVRAQPGSYHSQPQTWSSETSPHREDLSNRPLTEVSVSDCCFIH